MSAMPLPTSSLVLPLPARPAWKSTQPCAEDTLHIGLADLLDLMGAGRDSHACVDSRDRFAVQRVARGAHLVHEGSHAHALHVIAAGSFKQIKTAEDGYEHVLAFAWRGDPMGYEGLAAGRHVFAAVALEDSRVVALPRTSLPSLRQRVPAFDAALQVAIARQLAHAGEIAEVMAAVAADVRLARFLLQLSQGMAARGQSPRRLLLRMSRRDIASHIGLANETISRALRALSDAGILHVADRDVEILDVDGLARCARSTRGIADEDVARQHHAQARAA